MRAPKEGSITEVIFFTESLNKIPLVDTCGTVGRLDRARGNIVIDGLHVGRGRMLWGVDQVANLVDGANSNTGVMVVQFLLRIGAADG